MCNFTLLLIWKGPRPALLIKGDTLTAVIVQRSLQVYKPLLVGRCVRVGVSVHPPSPESLVHVSFCMIYLVSSYWTRNNPNLRGYVWCFYLKTVFPDFLDFFGNFTNIGKVIIVKVSRSDFKLQLDFAATINNNFHYRVDGPAINLDDSDRTRRP